MMPHDPEAIRILGVCVFTGCRPTWQPGDSAQFTYSFPGGSCYPELEGRDGLVEIVGRAEDDAGDLPITVRFTDDEPIRCYSIRFPDGFTHTAFEDELTLATEATA